MYSFYVEEYKGTLIKTVTDFNNVNVEATAYVDNLVQNRDLLNVESVKRRYRFAICAAADVIFEESKAATSQKQSESVGNHSVTYRTKSTEEYSTEKRKKVMTYLLGTGLLYSAMR